MVKGQIHLLWLVVFLLMGSNHVPKAQFKLNRQFRTRTVVVSADTKVYKFVTWENEPFKKTPFKDWKYENPAETLLSLQSYLDYVKKENLVFKEEENDTFSVEIMPYYYPTKAVSFAQYNRFINYVRDSIVKRELGGNHLKYSLKGDEIINWEVPIDYNTGDVRNGLVDLYYSAFYERFQNRYIIDKRVLTYQRIPRIRETARQKYLDSQRSTDEKRYSPYIYPDSALWFNDTIVGKDSALALALTEAHWDLNRRVGNMPMWQTQDMSQSYAQWMERQWFSGVGDQKIQLTVVPQLLDTQRIKISIGQEQLQHFLITQKMYGEFVTYCRDSFIRFFFGGSFIIMDNAGMNRQNIKTPLRLTEAQCDMLKKSRGDAAHGFLHPDRINYYYETHDFRALWEIRNSGTFSSETDGAYPYGKTPVVRFIEKAVPDNDIWKPYLEIDRLKKRSQKISGTEQPVTDLSYKQAKAFWHWRRNIYLKDKDKHLADFLIPTYQEWISIQSGNKIVPKDVGIKYPLPSYSYRVYVKGIK